MNCKIAPAISNSPFLTVSKSSNPTKAHIPESISFASQMTKSRLTIKIPSGLHRTRPTARIEAFYALSGTLDSPYAVLGIEESGSTVSDIKKAYKQMARKYHPDVSPPDRVDEHTKRFIMVKEAYETLSNPQRKALYDRNSAKGNNYQGAEEIGEWRMRWQSQLDELKRRSKNSSRAGRISWGARMRTGAGI